LRKYYTFLEGKIKNSTLQAESKFVRKFTDKENLLNTQGIRIKDKLLTIIKNGEKDLTDKIGSLKTFTEYMHQSKIKTVIDRMDKLVPLVERNIRNREVVLHRNIQGAINGFDKCYNLILERFEKDITRTDIHFLKCFTERVNILEQRAKSIQAGFFNMIMESGKILNERTASLSNLSTGIFQFKEQSFSAQINRFQLSRYLKIASEKERSVTDKIQRLNSLKPENVLKRGYSITRDAQGQVIKSINQLEMGQKIVNQYGEGYSESIISRKGERIDEQ